jgi:NAD(P)-dependent dehydrogenase (short-subunit alcohol dehydrogenase family)
MKRLENKVVFITGGLSGIGKACAIAAIQEGARVAIVDIKSPSNESAKEAMRNVSSDVMFIDCDVSSFEEVSQAVGQVVKKWGSLDVALNNAGIGGTPNKVGAMSNNEWLTVIGVNLNGVFNCMRHQLAQMSAQKSGVIVNMASILSKVGFTTASHYVAAKHGVIGLTQTAALEYAEEGIRINAMCPAFIDTPMLAKGGITSNVDVKQHIESLHPMKRLGRSEEVASAFIFLASNESSFVTGTALDVDGGYLSQ